MMCRCCLGKLAEQEQQFVSQFYSPWVHEWTHQVESLLEEYKRQCDE